MSDVNLKKLNVSLKKLLQAGPERGGLILAGNKLHEFENFSENPEEGFLPQLTVDDLPLLDAAIGTWHTHPDATANLSVEDWETFTSWPDWIHAIVGTDGVRWYRTENGAVVNA